MELRRVWNKQNERLALGKFKTSIGSYERQCLIYMQHLSAGSNSYGNEQMYGSCYTTIHVHDL